MAEGRDPMDVVLYATGMRGSHKQQTSLITVCPNPCAEAFLLGIEGKKRKESMEGKKEGKGILIPFS